MRKGLVSVVLGIIVSYLVSGCHQKSPTDNLQNTMRDIDGNVYQTVQIGNQIWMAENLKVTHYRNGDPILYITSALAGDQEWKNDVSGAYCPFGRDETQIDLYGLLYNWYAVSSSNMIAPEGWHVPTDEEWQMLERSLGMSPSAADSSGNRGDVGGRLKEAGLTHWLNPNTGATDEVGFTAFPSGYRYWGTGFFSQDKEFAMFWTSTEADVQNAWYRGLRYGFAGILRSPYKKRSGYSLRLVKDSE